MAKNKQKKSFLNKQQIAELEKKLGWDVSPDGFFINVEPEDGEIFGDLWDLIPSNPENPNRITLLCFGSRVEEDEDNED